MSVYPYMLYDLEDGELKNSFATASTLETVMVDAINHRMGYVLGHWEPELCRVVDGRVESRVGGGIPADFIFQHLPIATSPPTKSDVNAEAARRITAEYPLWRQTNIIADGDEEEIAAMREVRLAIVKASNDLSGMSQIPDDYAAEKWWPSNGTDR